MIGNKHTLSFHILQIFRKLSDIVKEAGRLNDNGFPIFLHDEHLVVDKVIGLIGVQFNAAKIVDVHFAFCKFYRCKSIFVHDDSLLKMILHISSSAAAVLRNSCLYYSA